MILKANEWNCFFVEDRFWRFV